MQVIEGSLPDAITFNSVPYRPQNWIALSRPSDTLHGLEESSPCPRLPKVPPFDFARRDTRLKPFISRASRQAQLPSLPIHCYDCSPGNSYHIRIINHERAVGVAGRGLL